MPRRCHGIRGDVGIAPYGTTIDRQCVGADAHFRPSPVFLSLRQRFALPPPSQREALGAPRLRARRTDCRVASLLAMTPLRGVAHGR